MEDAGLGSKSDPAENTDQDVIVHVRDLWAKKSLEIILVVTTGRLP